MKSLYPACLLARISLSEQSPDKPMICILHPNFISYLVASSPPIPYISLSIRMKLIYSLCALYYSMAFSPLLAFITFAPAFSSIFLSISKL